MKDPRKGKKYPGSGNRGGEILRDTCFLVRMREKVVERERMNMDWDRILAKLR